MLTVSGLAIRDALLQPTFPLNQKAFTFPLLRY